jgi:hypothetical protein
VSYCLIGVLKDLIRILQLLALIFETLQALDKLYICILCLLELGHHDLVTISHLVNFCCIPCALFERLNLDLQRDDLFCLLDLFFLVSHMLFG